MNLKEYRQKLKCKFEPYFEPLGFVSKIIDGVEFQKKFSIGMHIAGFTTIDYQPVFRSSFLLEFGITSVHRLYRHIAGLRIVSKIPHTFRYPYGTYKGLVNHDFKIENDDDLEKCYQEITHFMDVFGIDYFKKYSTLESFDELFNSDPTHDLPFLDNIKKRSTQGIIIAKLSGNPKLDQIIEIYRDRQKSNIELLKNFDMYAKFIKEHTTEELIEIAKALK